MQKRRTHPLRIVLPHVSASRGGIWVVGVRAAARVPDVLLLLLALAVTVGVAMPAFASEGGGGEEAVAEESDEVSYFYLRSGGVLVGRPSTEELSIETRYGELTVPLSEIGQIRFAPRMPAAERRRIEQVVARLGDPDFDVREAAMAELRDIGSPARRFLKRALRSGDEEIKNRAASLLAEIRDETRGGAAAESEFLEPLRDTDDDEVVTERFTVRGRVVRDRFSVSTRYGPLEVAREDLAGIILGGNRSISKNVAVGPKFFVPKQWLDTQVTLPPGFELRIEAKGQLRMSNVSSGPEGTPRFSGSAFGGFRTLSLVGKIGKRGKPFLVGKSYRGRAKRQGRLYLGVVPYRRTLPTTGAYRVEIRAER